MKNESDWIPSDEQTQVINFEHLDANIDDYVSAFGINGDSQKKIHAALRVVIAAIRYAMAIDVAKQAVTQWKKGIKNNPTQTGQLAEMPPVADPFVMPSEGILGAFDYLRKEVKLWKLSDGYSPEAGIFLRIVTQSPSPQPDNPQPVVKWETMTGYKIVGDWKKAGYKLAKFRYYPKGTSSNQDFVRGNSPAALQIVPQTAGQAESGFVQAVYEDGDGNEIGSWSDPHPVTIS